MPFATAAVALGLLHGLVTFGPTTPVCRQGTPCSRPAAHVRLVFTHHGTVRATTADARGRYAIRLAPGTWTVRSSIGVSIAPARVRIVQGAAIVRNFRIDSGIR